MYKTLFMIWIIAIIPFSIFALWDFTFFSGALPNGQRIVQTESNDDSLYLCFKQTDGIHQQPMSIYMGFPSIYRTTIENYINDYIGFRQTIEGTIHLNPLPWNQTTLPPQEQLTLAVTDPIGDHNFALNNLDIVSVKCSFNDNKLYFALRNNSSGFPVSSGFTYYSYMVVLINPYAEPDSNPTPYGLMYTVNIPGIISPGLYKLNGTGVNDLTLLGSINTLVDNNNQTLILSCNLADLMSDVGFSSWFNTADPQLAVMAMTSRITLASGTQTADQSKGFNMYLTPRSINNSQSIYPQLLMPQVYWLPDQNIGYGSVRYFSSAQYLPVDIYLQFDNGDRFDLNLACLPLFSTDLCYQTQPITYNPSYQTAAFYASVDQVHYADTTIVLNPQIQEENLHTARGPVWALFPNPAYDTISILFSDKTFGKKTCISIFDLKGRLMVNEELIPLSTSHSINLRNQSIPLPPGLYFFKVRQGNSQQILKLMILKK